MTTAATAQTPAMEGVYHGIPVAAVGDMGDMLALGHHDKHAVLAAFEAHLRTLDPTLGLDPDCVDMVVRTRAVFSAPDPARGDDPGCLWIADWSDPDHPDAQPVTLLTGL